jgi:hypothetical protein
MKLKHKHNYEKNKIKYNVHEKIDENTHRIPKKRGWKFLYDNNLFLCWKLSFRC